MGSANAQDFIYLDIERVRSFLAQLNKGLVAERISDVQNDVDTRGTAGAGLGPFLKIEGGTDYHYQRSHSETKSLHDHIFTEMYQALVRDKKLRRIGNAPEHWIEESFEDGTLVEIKGVFRIFDYLSLALSISSLSTFINLMSKTETPRRNRPGESYRILEESGSNWSTIKQQFQTIHAVELAEAVKQLYGDTIKIRVHPFREHQEKSLIALADRTLFRYSPNMIMSQYGTIIDANWTGIFQINKSKLQPQNQAPKASTNIEDAIEIAADQLAFLYNMLNKADFPMVSAIPIAIYRSL
jgi:hypothetical protein